LPELHQLRDAAGTATATAIPPTTTSTGNTIAPEFQPWNLCLDAHHSISPKNKLPCSSFDIDSICAFPTSLAVAKLGIDWIPQSYQPLLITNDIHLGIPAWRYTKGLQHPPVKVFQPLHHIRHYCFGKIKGMEALGLYIFFPSLQAQYNLDAQGNGEQGGNDSGNGSGSDEDNLRRIPRPKRRVQGQSKNLAALKHIDEEI